MPKYLILSPDPSHRWEIPETTALSDIEEMLALAFDPNTPSSSVRIEVVIDGQVAVLNLRPKSLSIAAVVEVSPQVPTMADYASDLGRR